MGESGHGWGMGSGFKRRRKWIDAVVGLWLFVFLLTFTAHGFAGDTVFSELYSAGSPRHAETIIDRMLGHNPRHVDRFLTELPVSQFATLNKFAVGALFRQSSVGFSLPILANLRKHERWPVKFDPNNLAVDAEFTKIYRELTRYRKLEQAKGMAIGSTVAWTLGWAALAASQPPSGDALVALSQLALGTLVTFPTSFFSVRGWSRARQLVRHRLILSTAIKTLRLALDEKVEIDLTAALAIGDAFEEMAHRCFPERRLENNRLVPQVGGEYFDAETLAKSISAAFRHYARYVTEGNFQNQVVRTKAGMVGESLQFFLKQGLQTVQARYSHSTIGLFNEAINAFSPNLENLDWREPSDQHDDQDGDDWADTPSELAYRESAARPDEPVEPKVYLAKSGESGLTEEGNRAFAASFEKLRDRRGDVELHFRLAPRLFRMLSHDSRQKVFLPALERELPIYRGAWIRYQNLAPNEFVFVSVDKIPEEISLQKTGTIEMWARPWSDENAYARFRSDRAEGPIVAGEALRRAIKGQLFGEGSCPANLASPSNRRLHPPQATSAG